MYYSDQVKKSPIVRKQYWLSISLILFAICTFTPALQHVYYIDCWGIAPTLSYPLMLAPLQLDDSSDVVRQKIDLVARYIEQFTVLRTFRHPHQFQKIHQPKAGFLCPKQLLELLFLFFINWLQLKSIQIRIKVSKL